MFVVGTHLCANHTPVLTFCEVPMNLQHTMNGEHQKKLRAIRFRKDREAKIVPTGISNLRSATTPNGNCDTRSTTDTLQQAICKMVED